MTTEATTKRIPLAAKRPHSAFYIDISQEPPFTEDATTAATRAADVANTWSPGSASVWYFDTRVGPKPTPDLMGGGVDLRAVAEHAAAIGAARAVVYTDQTMAQTGHAMQLRTLQFPEL